LVDGQFTMNELLTVQGVHTMKLRGGMKLHHKQLRRAVLKVFGKVDTNKKLVANNNELGHKILFRSNQVGNL